jgi:hypothetical protein
MGVWREAAICAVVFAFALTGCGSSPDAPAATTVPVTPAPTSASRGLVENTFPPTLVDRNCSDFANQQEAQNFFREAGGPEKDLHSLDPDHNGQACDESSPSPVSSAAAAGVTQPAVATSSTQATTGPRREQNSSTGAVDGQGGGAENHSSCESSDPARCD